LAALNSCAFSDVGDDLSGDFVNGDGEEGSGIDDFAADNGIDCDGTGVAKLAICLLLL
jgi:hypothetical protein